MTTKTPKLSAKDFMAMDVHEPLSTEEINEINPQAAVDKTIGAEQDEVSDDASVDRTPARCWVCFKPMPCEEHANIEQLGGVTSHDIDPTYLIAAAHNADLETVVIVGMRKDGKEYFAASCADAAEGMYHLQRGIYKLNRIVDEGSDDIEEPSTA